MRPISHLRDILFRVLAHPEQHHDEQELFDELMVQRPRLLKVFDAGQRNSQEQRDIESGKTVLDGRPVAINSDFARQVIFLAGQIDCNERHIARLLHDVMEENPNIGPVHCLEATIASFHEERRNLADTLRYLFEATEAALQSDAYSTNARIAKFVRSDIIHGMGMQAGEMSLAHRIIVEIDLMDAIIGKADVARKNAGSNTIAPVGQTNPALGLDILNARYDSLKYERRSLAATLCFIARSGFISTNEIRLVVDWLSTSVNHSMSYYFLAAILLAFDPTEPQSLAGRARQALANDASLMTFMSKKLSPLTTWQEQGLKATVLLKWTMFLIDARHNDTALEMRSGFKAEELETQVWNGVQGDAFTYLALIVAQLERRQGSAPAASLVANMLAEQQESGEGPPEDFCQTFLFALESLVRSLITHASSELRKIKQRQEDLVLASARDRTRTASSRFSSTIVLDSEKSSPAPRHDIAMLYSFIGLLYAALPAERALQFWGSGPLRDSSQVSYLEYVETTSGRLPTFLQWAIWSTSAQDLTMLTSLYDMLSGLSKGQQCSELAYNFMARGGGDVLGQNVLSSSSANGPSVSWSAIFNMLETWASNAANPRSQNQSQSLGLNAFGSSTSQSLPSPQQISTPMPIGPQDVLLAQSFLRLLSTVVTHSVPVRTTIVSHGQFRAIPILVSLIPLGIPLELKGALFDTLSAFCEPGAGVPGVEICKAVWTLMERLEVINVRASSVTGFGSSLATGKGVEVELEQIEAAHRLYPATIPFLRLLSTLIHTPKRIPLKERVVEAEPLNTIPEALGQPYRLPGIGPFTAFVIDNVFNNISNREYSRPSDRWQTNDYCLCYIERALASFDLESLVTSAESAPLKSESIAPLVVHPGYDVMQRILSNTPLQTHIMTYIVEGIGGFEKDLPDEEPFFRKTIIRILRIVLRVLEIQDIFLEVLVPLLSEFDSASIIGQIHSRSFFTRFDQALYFGPQYIPALAAYMTFPNCPEVVLLSIKILTNLSISVTASTLVTLIQQSSDSDRILAGFTGILNVQSMDDVAHAEEFSEQMTGAGAADMEYIPDEFVQVIRLAALNLLIQDTEAGRPYPNIAHFLLLGGTSEHHIQDPHALGARKNSIHVLIDLLNAGVPRLKGKRKSRERNKQLLPLFVTLPGLAERCYQVIYQLCVHPRTSDFTARYLRSREDFFARQLASIPSIIPESYEGPYIQVLYGDGSRVTTAVATLGSFLRLRSFIFDLVALELHVLTHKNHVKGVTELLEILFGNETGFEEDNLVAFHEISQSHMRIVDFLHSMMFDWSDSLSLEPLEMRFLGQLNLQSCLQKDSAGCEIVDRSALLALLAAGKRSLHAQGAIVMPAQAEQLALEFNYILESCAVENHRRVVAHALVGGYESWRRLLDMSLTKCFDRLPHDRRENMLFDLLHALPSAIGSANVEETTAILLSETVLSSITKLREDRRHQVILQSVGGDADAGSLPAERLYGILRHILDGILDSNHVELVRGNLYAALINYINLIASAQEEEGTSLESQNSQISMSISRSLSASTLRESMSFNNSLAMVPFRHESPGQPSSTSLEAGSLAAMKGVMERLVATISRDAIDGTEVWKTIAFMLLDSLVRLAGQERQHVVHAGLNRHGILGNFVRGVKDADQRLQSVLKPDPDDLNPLYVYEAKMSLFIRMSQTRLGADKLLDAQLIPVLAQCDFLDARPEADQSFLDQDTFLPSAVQRYHQLFMPALQVVNAMIAILGSSHNTAMSQALNFLSSHGSTIAILLKNERDFVTLALLEEIHLLVALCANVLVVVPKADLLSPSSGIGSIHAAILSLSTRCLGRGHCFQDIQPQTDAELRQANISAFGFGSETKFDVLVRQKDRLLRKSIVAYIGAATEFTEPEITLVLSPITTTLRRDERATHFSATVPTIGDAVEALDDLCADLAGTLKQIADLGAELANKAHIAMEGARDVLRDVPLELLRDLDTEQHRTLVCQELVRVKTQARGEARVLLDTVEMLLLIVWRHLEYYAEPQHMNAPPSKTSLTNAMRLLTKADPVVVREGIAGRLGPALQRLGSLDMDQETLGRDWQASQGYIEIMCRRLRDSAGLHDEASITEKLNKMTQVV